MTTSEHRDVFPSTSWSRLEDPSRAAEAHERLARRYWRPIAGYVRACGVRSRDDVLDLTQGFFCHLLERRLVGRADRSRGRFRDFLKASLRNYMADVGRRRSALRRGGAAARRPLQAPDGRPVELPDPRGRRPDEVLDDLWRREVVAQALAALEADLAALGQAHVFALFRDRHLEDVSDHAVLAARHGCTRTDVCNRLARARRRFRAHLRAAVLPTVHDHEDVRAELSWLLAEEPGT